MLVVPAAFEKSLLQLGPKLACECHKAEVLRVCRYKKELVQLLGIWPIIRREKEHLVVGAQCQEHLGELLREDSFVLVLRGLIINGEHADGAQLVFFLLTVEELNELPQVVQVLLRNSFWQQCLVEPYVT